MFGITPEIIKQRRLAYLNISKKDIMEVAGKYLVGEKNRLQYKDVMFGNVKEKQTLEKIKNDNWKIDTFAKKLKNNDSENDEIGQTN